MTKNIVNKFLFIAIGLFLLRCNSAEGGFNAPTGSTVTAVPASFDFSVPATGAPNSCGTFIGLVTFQVHIPIGTNVAGQDPENSSTLNQPGNKINGVILAGGKADIYRFKDGVQTFNRDLSLADPVPLGTFPFVTDDRGLYHVIWTITECYDSAGTLITNSGDVTADIGVAQAVASIAVSGS